MKIKTSTVLAGLFGLINAQGYGYNHVPVLPESDPITRAFPDVDIDLYSPAFISPDIVQAGFSNGTQGPTSHDDMDAFLRDIADRNSYMTYRTANFTSEELRTFPFIHLLSKCGKPKVRVWIQAGVHGNEPAGDEGAMALLGKFDNDHEWARSILSKVEIMILPRYNPDGAFYFQRPLASNYDPNRDHVKLARQHTRQIKQLLNEFNPHVAIDVHEYSTRLHFGDNQYKHGSDCTFSAAKNLNIQKDIRDLSEELFAKNMGGALEQAGLRWEPYVTGPSSSNPDYVGDFAEAGTDAKIGRNAMGLTQAVVFLVELRGIGLADQYFQRRTASALTVLSAVLQTAADNAESVIETVEGGIESFISSTDDIIVTDYNEVTIRPYTMVDVNNGSVVYPPVRFASTTPAIANLTRTRPEAYLIPVAWADLAERLRVSGLEVETLSEAWSGNVETLTAISTSLETSYYEGAVRVSAQMETNEREITLPTGSFLVSSRQKNAALAFAALEPENIDSYVSFNIVPLEPNEEYPIFRVL